MGVTLNPPRHITYFGLFIMISTFSSLPEPTIEVIQRSSVSSIGLEYQSLDPTDRKPCSVRFSSTECVSTSFRA
jgi:hypothetical protein